MWGSTDASVPGASGARVRRFRKDASGSGTVEFVIWFPLFLAMFLVAFDISITLYSMSRMMDVARQAGRHVATGVASADEAADWANGMLPGHATFAVEVDDSNPYDVIVNISSGDISPSAGFIVDFAPDTLTASYVMRREAF